MLLHFLSLNFEGFFTRNSTGPVAGFNGLSLSLTTRVYLSAIEYVLIVK